MKLLLIALLLASQLQAEFIAEDDNNNTKYEQIKAYCDYMEKVRSENPHIITMTSLIVAYPIECMILDQK